MIDQDILARYLEPLLRGDRRGCRSVIEEAMQHGIPANSIYLHLVWPIMVEIDKLRRKEKITAIQEHLATRVNRTIVDQLQNKLPRRPERNKKIAICCAPEEIQELGAQMMTDLFESDGWEVRFLGGGLTNEDVLSFINEYAPDVLLVYGTSPRQAPEVRRLIDTVKSVNAWPDMKIMVSGGLFNRAEGLWEEMEADLYASNAVEALHVASCEEENPQNAQRTINRRKKRKSAIEEIENIRREEVYVEVCM